MSDKIWSRAEIESPCVKICVVDPRSRLCIGCYRSMDEIRDWSTMGQSARRGIMESLPERKANFRPKRKGGRAATKAD